MKNWLKLLLFIALAGDISASEYLYHNLDFEEEPSRLVIDELDNTGSIGAYDKKFSGYVCGDDSEYLCFISITWQFVIPKNLDAKQSKTWEYEGRKYQLEESDYKIVIFGSEYIVDVITARFNVLNEVRGVQHVYYSKERGIMAIGLRTDEEDWTNMYFLQGKCGFGAKDSCK